MRCSDFFSLYATAVTSRDFTALRAALSPTVAWHYPDEHTLSGVHRGPRAVIELIERLGSRPDEVVRVAVQDTFTGRRMGAAIVRHTTLRPCGANCGRTEAMVVRYDGALVEEVWTLVLASAPVA